MFRWVLFMFCCEELGALNTGERALGLVLRDRWKLTDAPRAHEISNPLFCLPAHMPGELEYPVMLGSIL